MLSLARKGSRSLEQTLIWRSRNKRYACLTHDIDLASGAGLEFGPGNNPVELPTGLGITYIDYDLKANADLSNRVPIDYAWSGSGSLRNVLGRSEYDFAIAAQVAQYVPNVLGWFRGIHTVLRPGGVLNLSLPDRRLMFDAGRNESTIAEMVEADVHEYDRPSVRQIFAHTYETLAVEPAQVWAGKSPLEASRYCGEAALALAYKQSVEDHATGYYRNCHCWVFTPTSFLDVFEAATRLGLFKFVLNQLTMPDVGGCEFYISLRRDVEEEPQSLLNLQLAAIHYLREDLSRVSREAQVLYGA
ncbi:methyltransferase domain-containing protein [Methylobacterium sp. R2-1]|uniref:methyltransferase domain-containing protein n=1 Tax=Methylobacterium sp. R2-1 TaxID=2587064 RepID=UPI00160CCBE8|nr:hypothetical protein [Methylobacterium sp. R2-1]MBB2959821.1 SAM-dependent methyltransferase [Methylobacterium sp. R2-1]